MRKLPLVAILCVLPMFAAAQSNPGFTYGFQPSVSQWNSYFSSKADVVGGALTDPTINGGTLNGSFSGAPTLTGTLGVGGSTTLLKNTGRDLTVSDGGSYVNVLAANNNPTYWRTNWELADTSAPQGNTEFRLLGFSGNTIPLSSAQTWVGLNAQATLSGSSSADQHFYQFTSQDDFVTAGAPNGAYTLTVSNVVGTGGAGAHTALLSAITTNGSSITAGANPVALEANAVASVNVGGTSGAQLGDQYGAYIQSTLSSGATYWTKNVGGEVDLSANSGSSVQETDGWDIVLLGGHASHGLNNRDSGLVFGSVNPSTGWDYGIRFGGTEASSPFQTTATLLWAGRTMTLANGIDFSNATFTSSEYAGPSFEVGPTVASYNARVEVTGSASGTPGITAVGAGTSPAANANLTLSALGTGVIDLGSGMLQTNSGTFAGGTSYVGDYNTGGAALFVNAITGTYSGSTGTYPGGTYASGCNITVSVTYGGCRYDVATAQSGTADGAWADTGVATVGGNGGQAFGGIFWGIGATGTTSAAAHGAFIGITSLSATTGTNINNGIEIASYGNATYSAGSAIAINNEGGNSGVTAFQEGIRFGLSSTKPNFSYAGFTDDPYPLTSSVIESAQYGISWTNHSFTTAEYAGPSFEVGPTVSSYNARVEVTGSASAAPGITVVGAGTSPATNASLNLSALGTSPIVANGPLQLKQYTVATLPTCNSTIAHSMASVSDATSPTYNAALTGGGAVSIPVYCNGTAWTAH